MTSPTTASATLHCETKHTRLGTYTRARANPLYRHTIFCCPIPQSESIPLFVHFVSHHKTQLLLSYPPATTVLYQKLCDLTNVYLHSNQYLQILILKIKLVEVFIRPILRLSPASHIRDIHSPQQGGHFVSQRLQVQACRSHQRIPYLPIIRLFPKQHTYTVLEKRTYIRACFVVVGSRVDFSSMYVHMSASMNACIHKRFIVWINPPLCEFFGEKKRCLKLCSNPQVGPKCVA